MYECFLCEKYVHHDVDPPIEVLGHLICTECAGSFNSELKLERVVKEVIADHLAE